MFAIAKKYMEYMEMETKYYLLNFVEVKKEIKEAKFHKVLSLKLLHHRLFDFFLIPPISFNHRKRTFLVS